jgi:hypothetical protein
MGRQGAARRATRVVAVRCDPMPEKSRAQGRAASRATPCPENRRARVCWRIRFGVAPNPEVGLKPRRLDGTNLSESRRLRTPHIAVHPHQERCRYAPSSPAPYNNRRPSSRASKHHWLRTGSASVEARTHNLYAGAREDAPDASPISAEGTTPCGRCSRVSTSSRAKGRASRRFCPLSD